MGLQLNKSSSMFLSRLFWQNWTMLTAKSELFFTISLSLMIKKKCFDIVLFWHYNFNILLLYCKLVNIGPIFFAQMGYGYSIFCWIGYKHFGFTLSLNRSLSFIVWKKSLVESPSGSNLNLNNRMCCLSDKHSVFMRKSRLVDSNSYNCSNVSMLRNMSFITWYFAIWVQECI